MLYSVIPIFDITAWFITFVFIGGIIDTDWLSEEFTIDKGKPSDFWHNMMFRPLQKEKLQISTGCTQTEVPLDCFSSRYHSKVKVL